MGNFRFSQTLSKQMREWRRDLHQYPELGWMEYRTTYYIDRLLKSFGFTTYMGKEAIVSESRMGVPELSILSQYENKLVSQGEVPEDTIKKMEGGNTGVVAVLDTRKPGPHIAFRFDIDALPIEESDKSTHFPIKNQFRSKNKGVMHACGHDGHISTGLGLSSFLANNKENLKGKYTLLFQPSEEGARGAKAMLGKGWLDDVDYFLSGHIGIKSLNIGDLVATTSGFLATTKINVTFTGRSAHAGIEPEQGKNALLAAATTALHVQGISPHSGGVTRVNVGELVAGSGRNIIADKANMKLETRGETTDLNQYMVGEVKRIICATANMYDVEAEIQIVGEGIETSYDDWWIPTVEQAMNNSEHIKHIIPNIFFGASEDVTFMMEKVKECGGKSNYFLFGTPLIAGHHHPEFDFEEDVLDVALETYVYLIKNLLNDTK
jgi:aminobenzoyl-glutamate utilization protein A